MSKVLFGRDEVAAEVEATETTTGTVRGVAGLMFVVGAVGCATPLAPLGAVMAIVGGIVWLLAPANHGATQAMVDEAGSGGCGAALWAVAGIFVIMGLALVAALAVGLTMVGGN